MRPRVVNAANGGPFTLDGTRTFLVGRQDVAVIDPGPEMEHHLGALLSILEGARRVSILVTHWHDDHAGLAAALAAELGGLPVYGPGPLASAPLADGDRVETDEGTLLAVATPGHARDHLAFHWPAAAAVFVGDLVLGQGDTTWVGEYPGCVAEYLASLDRLRELGAAVAYPSHGPPVREVGECLDRYESHRRARLAEVGRILALRPEATPTELSAEIYPDVPVGLGGAALSSIEAIVHHLRAPR